MSYCQKYLTVNTNKSNAVGLLSNGKAGYITGFVFPHTKASSLRFTRDQGQRGKRPCDISVTVKYKKTQHTYTNRLAVTEWKERRDKSVGEKGQ